MEILVAKTVGFCFGVKKAVNLAYKAAEGHHRAIYTLGPIIHNPQMVAELEKVGVYTKRDIGEIDDGTVIIRSHGVSLMEMEELQKRGLRIVDATCPFVKRAHEYVRLLSEEGYFIVIVGEKEHPEVKGILSYGGKDVLVAGSVEDLRDMPRKKKVGVVAQTTQPLENLQAIVSFCLKRTGELKVFNTICNATSIRQEESKGLARQVDCMVVVGGRNSANTNRLAEVCRIIQPNTHHIEVAEEINTKWFEDVERVGVTAGASTPEWIIKEVVEVIRTMNKSSISKGESPKIDIDFWGKL
ncbi:MAG: 4-hydroxy-3-methylbut-2-enyl diphosphate reductase [Deltaproteobacteria bacterium]|nr:4-hydroxy-3-methylbut-2-enyl diphosphate reductase [Deltaproteobacteria bacterium]